MTVSIERQQAALHDVLARRLAVLMGGLAVAAGLALPSALRSASAAPAEPMHFIGWQYNPQIVAENVETFKSSTTRTSITSWCRASTMPSPRPS